MERLTEWTGEAWIPRQERLNGKLVGHKDCMKRLAAYEDTGLSPEEMPTAPEMCRIKMALDELKEYHETGPTPEKLQMIDKMFYELCRELGEYRKLEKQGRILKIPCKVGDSVWDNDFGMPFRYCVTGFDIGITADDEEEHEELYIYYQNANGSIRGSCAVSEIGMSVFFTRREAEAKLAETEGRDAAD